MYNDVVKRLESLGYIVEESDRWILQFVIKKVEAFIKSECNISKIPRGLHYVAVDMACGEFLYAKKGSGQLADFDVEAAVKSIKEGDTAITYAIGDNSITLDGLIDRLKSYGTSQLISYRRFRW